MGSCSSAAGRAKFAMYGAGGDRRGLRWSSADSRSGRGQKEYLEGWRGFLRHLKERGLAGVQLIISDACIGLVEAAAELFPDAQWQRCVVHFYRNVFTNVPKGKVADVARMLKAIHAQEDRRSADGKVREVVAKLRAMRLAKAARLVEAKAHETLTYFAFPSNHWRPINPNNPLEHIIREMRPAHARGRCISRRTFCIDAGRGTTATHREYEVGQAALCRDGYAAQPAYRGGSRLRSDQATAHESAKDR